MKAMSDPTGPVTLGDLIREDKLLWVYCCDCYHERDVNPATVPLPAETPVPEVGKHMKCSSIRRDGDNAEATIKDIPSGHDGMFVEGMRDPRLCRHSCDGGRF